MTPQHIKTTFAGGKNPFLNAAIPPDLRPVVEKLRWLHMPAFQHSDIVSALSLSKTTVTWYIKKWIELGMVEKAGKNKAAQPYQITQVAKDSLK